MCFLMKPLISFCVKYIESAKIDKNTSVEHLVPNYLGSEQHGQLYCKNLVAFIPLLFFLKHVKYSDYNPKVRYLHALKC